jgi:hypothetical protein
MIEVGNLHTMSRLAFWVRGEQGGERIEFTVGSDPGGIPPTPKRPLNNTVVTLESTWQRYEIDLRGMELTNAIALFCWGATDQNNPNGAVFYLDDIQFEGVR